MDNNVPTAEKIVCPSIVFKVHDSYYAINSEHITGIMQVPPYQEVPEAASQVMGIFVLRGSTVTLVDMRVLFGYSPLRQELEQFESMIETVKSDHLAWVEELERCVQEGDIFTLSTDPHYCTFGQWYYGHNEGDAAIKEHLKGIEEPHRLLHEAGLEIQALAMQYDDRGVESLLNRIKTGYVPSILRCLDYALDAFRGRAEQQIALVFESDGEQQYGIVVDEVISVEELTEISDHGTLARFQSGGLVAGVRKSGRMEDIVLEIAEARLKEYFC